MVDLSGFGLEKSFFEKFPKLKIERCHDDKILFLAKGEIDIFDKEGIYWDSFEICIRFLEGFPNTVPIVFEVSEKIPRLKDRHISKAGECCLNIPHKLLLLAKKGIEVEKFIIDVVYPFFANQLYFESEGEYANGEYKHDFNGIQQFYDEELNLNRIDAVLILKAILEEKTPSLKRRCPCSKKRNFKNCHKKAVDFLLQIDRKQLKSDFDNFSILNLGLKFFEEKLFK